MAKRRGSKNSRRKRTGARRARSRNKRRNSVVPWILLGVGVIAAVGLIALGLRFSSGAAGTYYPPTDVAGHTESAPPSHILSRPMPLSIFKHMLEHADGSGPPGVIISYNCDDYDCEPDLVDQLRAIAEDYPEFVYLAPFPGMTTKIAVTRRGSQITLDALDEERIRAFIEQG